MLGIIGGTGLYHLEGLSDLEEHPLTTPFGKPSAPVLKGTLHGVPIFFLPRHGRHHDVLPSEINFRANIWALKSLGVTQTVSFSACGSLKEELTPGSLVVANQYVDFTKGRREASFFGEGLLAHISSAEPTCPHLTRDLVAAAERIGMDLPTGKTYVCVEGPRLGTKAESFMFRHLGFDVVGMTNVPESFLAREAQMAYVTVGVITDYDCWKEDPNEQVSMELVLKRYGESIEVVRNLIRSLVAAPLTPPPAMCRESLKGALFTPEANWTPEQRRMLEVLLH